MPHLDESGWLVQERKVVDIRGATSSHMGNCPKMKLFQLLTSVRRCDLLVCCREDIMGILKYLMVWMLNWVASKDILRRMGWSMMETEMVMPNQVEVPNGGFVKMNVLL